MKRVLEYLRNLAANNNKVWFDAHKDEYLLAKKVFEDFTEQLIAKVEAFDPSDRPSQTARLALSPARMTARG